MVGAAGGGGRAGLKAICKDLLALRIDDPQGLEGPIYEKICTRGVKLGFGLQRE